MQKPKNLLPGLFLCVFSRIAEPLVDFIAVIFGIFPFFIWGRLFCRKERCFRPILYRPFLYRPILHADSTKNSAHTTPLQRGSIWHAAAPPRKAPSLARPQPLKNYPFGALYRKPCLVYAHKNSPTQKTPGVFPGVWLMKSSFNLLLTHCGRLLAGCTGPACSRRPQ